MEEPLEELYFKWLCAKVLSIEIPIYFDLLKILHNTEFVWNVSGDENRAEDGIELRRNFLRETGLYVDQEWLEIECSIFEMLVAFAKRAEFQTDDPMREWFWEFLTNLELDEYRQVSPGDVETIEDILHTFIWRTYKPNGYGGMFPLRWPKHDQREVELWHQLFDYLEDQGRM